MNNNEEFLGRLEDLVKHNKQAFRVNINNGRSLMVFKLKPTQKAYSLLVQAKEGSEEFIKVGTVSNVKVLRELLLDE